MSVLTASNQIEAARQARKVARRFGHQRLSAFEETRRGASARCVGCRRLLLIERQRGQWLLSGGAASKRCTTEDR